MEPPKEAAIYGLAYKRGVLFALPSPQRLAMWPYKRRLEDKETPSLESLGHWVSFRS